MPFAKRPTYTLTLAISAALLSSYAVAESASSDAEMAWNCSMTKDGEWDCSVNEELIEEVEQAEKSTELSQSKTGEPKPANKNSSQPEQQAVESSVSGTQVRVEAVPPAKAVAIKSPTTTSQSETTRAKEPVATARGSSAGVWDCHAGSNGEWICNGDQTANRSAVASSTVRSESNSSTQRSSTQPIATPEIVGSEWQCSTSASGDWDCKKINIHALVMPGSTHQSANSEPRYIADNPYSQLDWAYYRDAAGQQCAGRYIEPTFPIEGDEHLDNPPVYLEAEESSTILGGLTQLQGQVRIRQGDRRLSASAAELDQVTNKARLEGNVRFREPGLLMLSDEAQIDTTTSEAIFTNAQYVIHEEGLRGTADRVIRLEDERLRLEKGKYTYCPPYSEAWQLSADNIVLNKAEGFGEAEDAVLRVGGVPIIYAPYFTFPIDDTRRSGFLYPSVSYSKDSGVDIAVPYYFNIAPNIDDTLTPRYISDRGLLLENELRYLNGWADNILSTAYLHKDDTTDDKRWLFDLNHKGHFAGNWYTNIDYTALSDNEYFDDLSPNLEVARENHLDQRADVEYRAANWSLRARVHDYQTIEGTAPYQLMPQITLKGSESFSDELSLAYEAEVTRFDRDIEGLTGANRITGDRRFIQPTLSYNWQRPWGYIKPRLSLWSSSYSLDNQLSGYSDSPNIFTTIASIDSGLYFDRDMSNGGLHTLEPRLFALYVPEEDQDAVPDFDTANYTFNYNYLFRENRFSGKDRIGDAQQISLGLTTRYITEDGFEKGTFSVGQAYYFADREVQLSRNAAADTVGQSDLATLGTWYLTPNLRTYLDTILDHRDYKVQSSTLGLKYKSDIDHIVDFRYRFTDLKREQTDLSFIWPLSQNWTSMGRLLYDIKGNETEEATLGLEYESCCWKVSFAGRQWLDGTEPDGSNKYDIGVFLQLTLKGLGSFGSGNSGFMNDIIGYEEREEHNEN
ncbi:LPS-assembly protein LptD [uncultured Neptuniibacter sp.]|uniref:LPS-assembly protein LptD n=1 Tax=uncultured Neptuniibacter sp. TaxID=502143 RepID=UPI002608503F|nr:LPS-assembly protein LptD [uncultured Neptuniibacter sp.]